MEMGGQSHAPAALPPRRIGAHFIGGSVDLRAGLDGWRKISNLYYAQKIIKHQ